jgi:cytochrome c553
VLQRRPEELFYVVKHGLKWTGMPAWPAPTRDEEVWGVVAFLKRLPDLDVTEYRRLARGDPAAALWELPEGRSATIDAPSRVIGEICARCHGVDGLGRGAFPKLAGQRAEYMDRALRAYAQGRRHSGIMGPIAESLSAEDRAAAVRHYASLPPFGPDDRFMSTASSHGSTIAIDGVASRMIPACVDCHGPSDVPTRAAYPRLAGQGAHYLARLRL